MRRFSKLPNQIGDTIVEVLVAVLVVSTVLVGAFLVSQKSAVAVRDSQEHGEMMQVLQGQVELIRAIALASTSNSDPIFSTTAFCVDNSSPTHPVPVAAGTAVCNSIQNRYNISATYDTTSKVFTVKGSWSGLRGETNHEQLAYRITAGSVPVVAAAGTSGSIADITATPCTAVDPITGACVVSGPPRYRWYNGYFNNSSNPTLTVIGCTWHWDDGSADEHTACEYGEQIFHTFPAASNLPPYSPTSPVCYTINHDATLTLDLSDGSHPTKTFSKTFPRCF